jgi:hypothetical protein
MKAQVLTTRQSAAVAPDDLMAGLGEHAQHQLESTWFLGQPRVVNGLS